MLEDVSLPVINVPRQPITGANNGYKLPVAVASGVAITAIIPELSIIVDNRYISEQVKKGKCVNPSAQYILIIQKDNKDPVSYTHLISPQSIAIATSAGNQQGKEGEILKAAIPYALVYVAITGIIVYIFS